MKSFTTKDSQCIKGIAIIIMMFHHCFANTWRYEGYSVSFFPFDEATMNSFTLALKQCVGMFAFISVFGMTAAYDKLKKPTRKDYERITFRRLFRMMNGYMLVFLLVQIISLLLGQNRIHEVYGRNIECGIQILIDFLGLADVFSTATYLGTWWYMSMAVIIVLSFPLLYSCYKKWGVGVSLLIAILPFIITFKYENMFRYMGVLMFGIAFAEEDLFEKWNSFILFRSKQITYLMKFVIEILLMYLMYRGRSSSLAYPLIALWDSLLPVVMILFSVDFIIHIKILRNILIILGNHSMNIYLIHNMFRVFWCPDFIYSFHSCWIIAIMLLLISLLFSFLLESCKKITGYYVLIQQIENKIETSI